jgi:hypothetical protein
MRVVAAGPAPAETPADVARLTSRGALLVHARAPDDPQADGLVPAVGLTGPDVMEDLLARAATPEVA